MAESEHERMGAIQVRVSDHSAHPIGCECDLCWLYLKADRMDIALRELSRYPGCRGKDKPQLCHDVAKAARMTGSDPEGESGECVGCAEEKETGTALAEWAHTEACLRERLRAKPVLGDEESSAGA